ncbi:MAG: hypothetical protein KDM64_06380 [Verrucomicrobiae bacterium]|nr:hypothetical protein [Verrucomicrobiae bacterium]MCB1091812.1 hypothetical protein [Verrucomicrobiae bacterium]
MKPILAFSLSLALLGGGLASAQNEAAPPANPDVVTLPARTTASKLTPKQQVTGFYALCKQGKAGDALGEILNTNPNVKSEDVAKVSQAFSQMTETMGAFLDYKIIRETALSDRVQVIRCVAHFEKQPFVNEFTFYDAGNGEWRYLHLKYDANPATMFQEDIRAAAQ